MAQAPEIALVDTEEAEEKQARDDFSAGYASEQPPPKKTVAAEAEPEPKAASEPEPKAETKVEAPAAETPPAPKYIQVTQEDWDALKTAANKTAGHETQLSKAFGTLGDLQQIIRKLQSQTPQGLTVELPADVVSEMEDDFPELAGHFKKGLEKALKGIKGTAPAAATTTATATTSQTADPEAVQKMVKEAAMTHELEALEDAHPTWRAIVGAVNAEGKYDANNDFRKWLAKEDAAYQQKVNSTNSSAIISRAIDKFQSSKTAAPTTPAKPAAHIVARNERVRGAIQPRGDGGQPAPTKTADDDFREGFRTG